MSDAGVGDDLRDLSIVEPDSFTAARNARAKELRAAKEKDRAAVVAKLPKPTWTAWALNVLARDQAAEIEAWLAAGDALDAALSGALSGDRDGLRDAQQGERVALGRAVDRAGEVLVAAGRKADDQARQRLTGTLRAAVTDPAVRDLLVAGTLAEDIEAPSFGFGFAAPDDGNVVSMAAARANRTARGGGTKKTAVKAKARRGDVATDDQAADDEEAEEARRAEAQRAAEEAEALRIETERLAAERSRLEAELAEREAELQARTEDATTADDAARLAHEALDDAAAAVEAARAALDAVPPV